MGTTEFSTSTRGSLCLLDALLILTSFKYTWGRGKNKGRRYAAISGLWLNNWSLFVWKVFHWEIQTPRSDITLHILCKVGCDMSIFNSQLRHWFFLLRFSPSVLIKHRYKAQLWFIYGLPLHPSLPHCWFCSGLEVRFSQKSLVGSSLC